MSEQEKTVEAVKAEVNVVFEGILIKARTEAKEYKGRKQPEKFHISLADVKELPKAVVAAYKDAGDRFTPSWVKKFEGFVNLSTKYDLPVKDENGRKYPSFQDMISDGYPFMRSKVKIGCVVKEGAIYPKSLLILAEGEEYDPFAMFD